MTSPQVQLKLEARARTSAVLVQIAIAAFSIFYFANVLIRQSEKYYWYDELCTVLYCRLDFHSLLLAQQTGLDLSPLFFHLLTKGSQTVLGAGRLGTRAPEILGFWILCLCLFRFTHRRFGLAAGVIAMLFPVFTESLYYAYEARPYGLILGFCGLALVSWQMLLESKPRDGWFVFFSISLLGAFLLHSFALLLAVPFCLAELYFTLRTYSIRWRFWIAIAAPALIALLTHIPGFLTYRRVIAGSNFGLFAPHDWGQISHFYIALLAPCILLIVFAIAIIATALLWPVMDARMTQPEHLVEETIVALCFSALPALGIFVAKAMHAWFFARYFSSALVGICLLLAMALSLPQVQRIGRPVFTCVLVLTALWQMGSILWNHHRRIPNLLPEPSGGFAMNVTRAGPLSESQALLDSVDAATPIGVSNPVDFLYLVYYSPELRSRLYYVEVLPKDPFPRILDGFRPLSPISYNSSVTLQKALSLAPRVAIWSLDGMFWFKPLMDSGAHVRLLQVANYRFIVELEK